MVHYSVCNTTVADIATKGTKESYRIKDTFVVLFVFNK